MASSVGTFIKKALIFLTRDIWRMTLTDLPTSRARLIRAARILTLAIKGFRDDQAIIRSSALTYFSLLSIVPLLAMIFGFAKGFGLQDALTEQLHTQFEGQEAVLDQAMKFANKLLENTHGELIAGFGIAFLFYTTLILLNNIEEAFNDIWYVKKQRSLISKFNDYTTILLIGPVLIIVASSFAVYATTQISTAAEEVAYLRQFTSLGFKFVPYVLIWLVFSLMYIVMPNTHVSWRAAIWAGIIAGSAYVIMQYLYIRFQVKVSSYNTIYGSFAALPLFFIWMRISWVIILLGAELSYAIQNAHLHEFEYDAENLSFSKKRLLSLVIVHTAVSRFLEEKKPFTREQFAQELDLPIRVVNLLIEWLVQSGILSENITDENKEYAYQPAVDTDLITVQYVIDKLENLGEGDLALSEEEKVHPLVGSLNHFEELIQSDKRGTLIKNLGPTIDHT